MTESPDLLDPSSGAYDSNIWILGIQDPKLRYQIKILIKDLGETRESLNFKHLLADM